jgi:Ca2+-binding EF-hand superfamily protein
MGAMYSLCDPGVPLPGEGAKKVGEERAPSPPIAPPAAAAAPAVEQQHPLRAELTLLIRDVFRKLDTNGDGSLTRAEFFSHLSTDRDASERLGTLVGVPFPTRGDDSKTRDLSYALAIFERAHGDYESGGVFDHDDNAESFSAADLCSFVTGDESAQVRLDTMLAAERARAQRLTDARFARKCKRAAVQAMLTTAQRQRLFAVFDAIDSDGDAIVSLEELRRILPSGEAHASLIATNGVVVEATVEIDRAELATFDADDVSGACARVGMSFLSGVEFVMMVNGEAASVPAASVASAVAPQVSPARTETIVSAWEHGASALRQSTTTTRKKAAGTQPGHKLASPFVVDRGW